MSLTHSDPASTAKTAKVVSRCLATLDIQDRNNALIEIHKELKASASAILQANAEDVAAARERGSNNPSMLSRLDLSKPGKYSEMLRGILDVAALPDPIGVVSLRTKLDDGLILERISCPIGVLLVIFEARPEVIANIASLAIKSGNAVILKGGSESSRSFVAIADAISRALDRCKSVPKDAVQLVATRDVVAELLKQDQFIDLVIPRGSNELVRYVKATTRIPVMGHADGLCSVYVEGSVDAEMAAAVVVDAKTSYPAACNAVETLLVQEAALAQVWPRIAACLVDKKVELRCDGPSRAALDKKLPSGAVVKDAAEEDFRTEFLSLVLAVKTVKNVDEAIDHINEHGSHHTEAILTAAKQEAELFMNGCDSADVYWNTSTRMADGFRYGFGTEVGVSTAKIHARGPVGMEGLMIYKYKIRGTGQVSAEYGAGDGKKRFKHEHLPVQGITHS